MTDFPQDANPASIPDTNAEFSPATRRYILIAAILASSMGFIDGTIVSLAMPAIRSDLGASLADAQWINNAYMLFLSALVLSGGAAGDVFGARKVFGIGVGLFTVTSVLCAAAPDESVLIAMRGAQGIGAALMVPGSLSIIAKSHPPDMRGQAIGTWAAVSAVTTALGPIVGSTLLSIGDDWMWRLLFAINVPFGLIVLFILFTRVPKIGTAKGSQLDLPGAVLATLALGAVSWGLTSIGLVPQMRLAHPAIWIVAGIFLAGIFVFWESRTREPMVDLDLFSSCAFSGANLYTLIQFLAFNAVLFYLPMVLIAGWGVVEWQASLMFAPLSIFIGVLSRKAGRFSDRNGPRLPLTAGALCAAVAYALLALTMPLMELWTVTFPIMCLAGLGMGMLVSPLSAAVMRSVGEDDAGVASGINNAIARSAGLLAVAAFGPVAGLMFAQISGGVGDIAFGAFLPDEASAATRAIYVDATNAAFRLVALSCSVLCGLAAVIAWMTQPSWRGSEKPAAVPDP